MFDARLIDKPDTLIFWRAIAIKHQAGRADATEEEQVDRGCRGVGAVMVNAERAGRPRVLRGVVGVQWQPPHNRESSKRRQVREEGPQPLHEKIQVLHRGVVWDCPRFDALA